MTDDEVVELRKLVDKASELDPEDGEGFRPLYERAQVITASEPRAMEAIMLWCPAPFMEELLEAEDGA